MKNLLLMLGVVVTALFTFGCNNEKKKLMGKIETDISTYEPAKDSIVSGHIQIGQLVTAMTNADQDLKRTEEYTQLYMQAYGMRIKYTKEMNTYLEKIDSLKQLNADLDKKQLADSVAQQKYAVFSQNLSDYKSTFENIRMHQTENTSKFAQLQEKFSADPAAFHLAPEVEQPAASPAPQGRVRGDMPASTNSPSLTPSLVVPPKKQ